MGWCWAPRQLRVLGLFSGTCTCLAADRRVWIIFWPCGVLQSLETLVSGTCW